MPSLSRSSRLARLAVAGLLCLSAAACSDGDDETTGADADRTESEASATGEESGSTTETETETDAGGTEEEAAGAGTPYEGYDGYESKEYDGTTNWICHPDLEADECTDVDTTVIQPDGTREVQPLEPAEDPPVDCFYAYPTTSSDPPPSADFDVDASEIDTVRAQVARYSQVCRVFAPAYRQVSLAGLTTQNPEAREQAYGDVLDAWKTYMTQQNDGRGVVLIGHSQGAGILRRLMTEEMDPNPELRRHLVSALLLGTTVTVPEGEDVGGDFDEIPACRTADATGCVISFVSYAEELAPTEEEGARFGLVTEEGQQALCVNPVELAGGNGLADAVMLAKPSLLGSAGGTADVDTAFVSLPGVLEAECVVSGPFSYLSFARADAGDQRNVDPLLTETLGPTWGLHLLDANLVQGDLVEVVETQAEAYAG